MSTPICTRVERTRYDGCECLLITASCDEPTRPPADGPSLRAAKAKLAGAGITLGGARQVPSPSGRDRFPSPPVTVLVDSDSGRKSVVAEAMDLLELSAGSILFRLYVFDLSDDPQWVVGKHLELVGSGMPALPWETGA